MESSPEVQKSVAILGGMPRDVATAQRLQKEGCKIHSLSEWDNPDLIDISGETDGDFLRVDSLDDPKDIAAKIKELGPTMVVNNSENTIKAGVIDEIKETLGGKVLIPGADQSAGRVETDKFFARQLAANIDEDINPKTEFAETEKDVIKFINMFERLGIAVALKPRNPAGGKGVKISSQDFRNYQEAKDYGIYIIRHPDQEGIEIQEEIMGANEFDLQNIASNIIIPSPAIYDFPFREDDDTGPGTGGMAGFSQANGLLPFLTEEDHAQAFEFSTNLKDQINKHGSTFKGVLFVSFFKTDQGLKFIEANARGGDPEWEMIIDLLEDDVKLYEVLEQIATGTLKPESVRYKEVASVLGYLVSPRYAYESDASRETFRMKRDVLDELEVIPRFAAAERVTGNTYRDFKTSRVLALSTTAETPLEGSNNLYKAINRGFVHPLRLDYRGDIATEEYLAKLAR